MSSTLFQQNHNQRDEDTYPLAWRMRPATLGEFLGQDRIVGKGSVLRRAIEDDTLSSIILWGPPGSGKTTLAKIISNLTKTNFVEISAVTSKVAEVRDLIDQAKERLQLQKQRTTLLIDEIHRFNKAQQDALLPAVEDGTIILIGVTTENPYFEVNSPLISRSRVFVLEALSTSDILVILKRALSHREKGLAKYQPEVEEEALKFIAEMSQGDARQALNALEMAVMTTEPDTGGARKITVAIARDATQNRAIIYDRDGDSHYDIASAFIKSIRGSDPDAALYWLARMILGGEDPKFIARRMIIAASEDIGLADSRALEVAVAAARAVEFVGLPEARINLAHAVIYLSTAPKSNSVIRAIDGALNSVKDGRNSPVPKHLRDSHYPGAKKLGHGKGYKYPHNYQDGYIHQDYLPGDLTTEEYYAPSSHGDEKRIKDYIENLAKENDSLQ